MEEPIEYQRSVRLIRCRLQFVRTEVSISRRFSNNDHSWQQSIGLRHFVMFPSPAAAKEVSSGFFYSLRSRPARHVSFVATRTTCRIRGKNVFGSFWLPVGSVRGSPFCCHVSGIGLTVRGTLCVFSIHPRQVACVGEADSKRWLEINWCWRHFATTRRKADFWMLGTSEQEVAFWRSLSLAQRRQLVGEKKHVILQSLRKKHLHTRNCPCCAHRKLSFDVNAGLLIWIPYGTKELD